MSCKASEFFLAENRVWRHCPPTLIADTLLSMNVVELFAGIGGFRLACDELGLKTIWANDNCPQACAVYRAVFGGDILHEGEIESLLCSIPKHDLLTGGFPCQPFSSAGKKKGIEDPRGTLFQSIVDVLRELRPRHFVLENVKRLLTMDSGRHFATILDALSELDYAIEWRLINAMDLGLPQNRQRVFIVGTLCDQRERGASVRLTDERELAHTRDLNGGLLCSFAAWPQIAAHGARFPTWGLARAGRFYGTDLDRFSEVVPKTLLSEVLQKPGEVGHEFDFTDSTLERLKASTPVDKYVGGVEILSNQGGGARMGYTVFGVNGLAPTLTCTQSRHYERYKIGDRYRRLTNIEYARIQGFGDHHCDAVHRYAQYVLYGNAVPPRMAKWALTRTLTEGHGLRHLTRVVRQSDLFAHVG